MYIYAIFFLLLRFDKWNENMSQKREKSSEIVIYVLIGSQDNFYYVGTEFYKNWRSETHFNLLKTKRNLLYIRNHSVARCKHCPTRL
jgi:hypothetical protein